MTHYEISRLLAFVFLVCVATVFLIEAFSEIGSKYAMKLKWSLLWSACRYLGAISGTLLALDVFF